MKITAIKSLPFQSEYGRRNYLVKVETDEGIYGLGEVGMAFWGAAVEASLEHLWQHMFRGSFFPADTGSGRSAR